MMPTLVTLPRPAQFPFDQVDGNTGNLRNCSRHPGQHHFARLVYKALSQWKLEDLVVLANS